MAANVASRMASSPRLPAPDGYRIPILGARADATTLVFRDGDNEARSATAVMRKLRCVLNRRKRCAASIVPTENRFDRPTEAITRRTIVQRASVDRGSSIDRVNGSIDVFVAV